MRIKFKGDEIERSIVAKAKEAGAFSAGVARVTDLQRSNSYELYRNDPSHAGRAAIVWPEHARSVLVLALEHKPSEPWLDWWGQMPGKTLGNHHLIVLAESMVQWLQEEHGIGAYPLPYHVEKGGVFLKDAAILAGLGVLGKNNLLVTPEFGPRVRLRALFLDVELEPTGPVDFDPCAGCDAPCQRACPKRAFEGGSYQRPLCREMMNENEEQERVLLKDGAGNSLGEVIRYCRACELACPVAR